MRGNYFYSYKFANSINKSDICPLIKGYILITLFMSFVPIFIDSLVGRYSSLINYVLLGLISPILLCFIIVIVCGLVDYFTHKKDTYSLFKFKDFKEWYTFTPEKFVFDNDICRLYYVYDGVDEKDKYLDRSCFKENNRGVSILYPATLIDFIMYRIFVRYTYCGLAKMDKIFEKNKKNLEKREALIQKHKDIVYANNEMLKVVGSIQRDIDDVLSESRQIITDEILKIEKLNKAI